MFIDKLPVEDGKCYFFTDRLNRRYLSGVDIAEGFLIVSSSPVYFTDMRYFSAAKKSLEKAGIRALPYISEKDLKTEINAQGITSAFMDYTRTTLAEYNGYKKLFGAIEDCSDKLQSLRSLKSADEIENIKKACGIAQNAVAYAFDSLKEGMTEKELSKILEDCMLSLGAFGAAFDTIVAFGAGSAVPHHETGLTALKRGDVVLIDTGCKVNGYCSDITRTAFFGEPTEEFLYAYGAVLDANETAEREIYGGISGKDADNIARNVLNKSNLAEYFTHSLGHGVGLEIHESPRLSVKSCDKLENGMVFTVEPGVYLEDKFGIRIEDTCVMEDGRVKRLFSDDKKPLIIKAEKL